MHFTNETTTTSFLKVSKKRHNLAQISCPRLLAKAFLENPALATLIPSLCTVMFPCARHVTVQFVNTNLVTWIVFA